MISIRYFKFIPVMQDFRLSSRWPSSPSFGLSVWGAGNCDGTVNKLVFYLYCDSIAGKALLEMLLTITTFPPLFPPKKMILQSPFTLVEDGGP